MLDCGGRSLPKAIADGAGDPSEPTPHQLPWTSLIWRCCGFHLTDPGVDCKIKMSAA